MLGRRVHSGLLNSLEAPVVARLTPKVPDFVQPDHLSLFSVVGAGVCAVGLVGCRFSSWFLLLVVGGLIANWFGDSFDGAVARYRRRERPRVGFLIDRCADTMSFVIMIFALGFSPFLQLHLALMLLVAYLINSIYGLMKLVVDGVQVIGASGVGATEGRLVIGIWAVAFQLAHVNPSSFLIAGVPAFDVACGVALMGVTVLFVWRIFKDIDRQQYFDRGWTKSQSAVPGGSKVVPMGRRTAAERASRAGVEGAPASAAELKSP